MKIPYDQIDWIKVISYCTAFILCIVFWNWLLRLIFFD